MRPNAWVALAAAPGAVLSAMLGAVLGVPHAAHAQRPQFGPTIFWDAGLINTPAAFVAPLGGDLSFSFARMTLDSAKALPGIGKSAAYDFSASASLFGHAEVGISVFSGDLNGGLFAKGLVWDQTDGTYRTGMLHWLPSVALGIRNVGTERGLDRFGRTGQAGFNTSPTLYAVATRTVVLAAPEEGTRPRAQLSVSAGIGNGLFVEDGGLGKAYARSSTHGLFGGAQVQFATGRYSSLSLLAEHDAWDVNAGAQAEWRGLRASLYATELGAGSGTAGSVAYRKIVVALGWQTNASALLRGNRMDERIAEIGRQTGQLRADIAASEQRVRALDAQITALKSAEAAGLATERMNLERRLREEQDALKRLQELLKAREAQKKP